MVLPVHPLSIRAFVDSFSKLETGSMTTGIEISQGPTDVADWFVNLVELFDGGLTANSKFVEELISEFSESFFVHPKH